MEEILCDISAFRFHRTPPQVLMLCPPFPQIATDKQRIAFKNHLITREITGIPAHLLVGSPAQRRTSQCTTPHLVTHEMPLGHIQDTDLGIRVSSPLLTLFQLARHMQEDQLLLAMYEFCGSFSVFKPSPVIESLLEASERDHLLSPTFGWTRVVNRQGQKTSLWMREPIVEIGELHLFASKMRSERGGRRFERAANRVTGITASPFEAQASILFATPRGRGGEGFAKFVNNEMIPLSKEAQQIAGKRKCYADILFEAPQGGKPLIIECQGKVAHDSQESAISDSDRIVALQQMGFVVMPITYKQIADRATFDVVRRVVAKHLGIRYRDKSEVGLSKEIDLRRNIFIDWSSLG